MAVNKVFDCENCGAIGKIQIKGDDLTSEDIVYCPVCSADIYEEDLRDDDD